MLFPLVSFLLVISLSKTGPKCPAEALSRMPKHKDKMCLCEEM